jgi:hypothetical protein
MLGLRREQVTSLARGLASVAGLIQSFETLFSPYLRAPGFVRDDFRPWGLAEFVMGGCDSLVRVPLSLGSDWYPFLRVPDSCKVQFRP